MDSYLKRLAATMAEELSALAPPGVRIEYDTEPLRGLFSCVSTASVGGAASTLTLDHLEETAELFRRELAGKPVGPVRVFESDFLPYELERVQVRFPRSKRKRIRKKWSKDPRNFVLRRVFSCVQMGPDFFMSPDDFARLVSVQP